MRVGVINWKHSPLVWSTQFFLSPTVLLSQTKCIRVHACSFLNFLCRKVWEATYSSPGEWSKKVEKNKHNFFIECFLFEILLFIQAFKSITYYSSKNVTHYTFLSQKRKDKHNFFHSLGIGMSVGSIHFE